MDLLLLHVPKFDNYYPLIDGHSFILFPPMGLLGLADFLRTNHKTSQLIHLAVEQSKYGQIDFGRILADTQPVIVGLDLHWHFQAYDVIEVSRKIKQTHPQIPILLGGITASLFAGEILRDFPSVDFVIRGDAEIPLLELLRHFESDKNYAAVPNLTYRDEVGIRSNPTTYVADNAMVDSLCYTDFSLMKDFDVYVNSFSRYVYLQGISRPLQSLRLKGRRIYPVYIGRGCEFGCSFCGGSREAHKRIGGRTFVSTRSADSILKSLVDLARFGFDCAYFGYDLFPRSQSDEIYAEIFDGVRRLDIPLALEVECWTLPTRRFLESFRSLHRKGSHLSISVHSQNEELRRLNRLYRFSNAELEESLRMIEEYGIDTVLYFAAELPYESREDLEKMAEYQRYIRKKFKHVTCKTSMIEIEPGSSLSTSPDLYQVQPQRYSFADYYHYHSQPSQNVWSSIGYLRPNCPGHSEVSSFYCRHFCDRINAGLASPLICNGVSLIWKTGVFRAINRLLPK